MRTFTDNAGRTWTIAVHIEAIKRVRDLLGLDLLEVAEGKLIDRLIRDPVLLCDVVYVLCKPEADAPNISDADFGRAMAGDAIEHATTALLQELVGFSPSPRDRAILGRVLAKTREAMDRARDLIEARLDSGQIEQAIERMLEPALANAGSSSGAAPASSASTPDG